MGGDRNSPQKVIWRAQIVVMWARGDGVTAVVRATGKTKRTAYRWRDRYVAAGIGGLKNVGGLGCPDEGLGVGIVVLQIGLDRVLEKVARGRRVLESQH